MKFNGVSSGYRNAFNIQDLSVKAKKKPTASLTEAEKIAMREKTRIRVAELQSLKKRKQQKIINQNKMVVNFRIV